VSGLTAAEVAGMRGDVEDVALSMRCTIERLNPGAADAYGHPTGTWEALHADLPCLLWHEDRRTDAETIGPSVSFVLGNLRLAVPANTDVNEQDRVSEVIGMDGDPIAGVLAIHRVQSRITDTVLVVEEVSG